MYYSGAVIYSDMLIRFEFNNHFNALEKDLLYIVNYPLSKANGLPASQTS